jgi:hypothetical protein
MQRKAPTMTAIKWTSAGQNPPAKERLFLIVSAAGHPPTLELMDKSEVAIGYWTGDAFRLMSGESRAIVTHWAPAAPYLPDGIDLIHHRIFDADARE